MKLFRKILFWSHLFVGVLAAVVVIVMSATGVLLAYQKQITTWADTRALDIRPLYASSSRLPATELIRTAESSVGAKATSITLRAAPHLPAEISFGRERRELIDPYTGATLGHGSEATRAFFRIVTAWHRTLGATGENRALGKQITGAANLGFLFLVVSGFYLWWPRNWSVAALRNVTLFRRRLSGKARDFNWHNVIGFWSAVPLLIIVASGVVISYRWAGNLVYRAVGEAPPAAAAPAQTTPARRPTELSASRLDSGVALAARHMPEWRSITVQLPTVTARTMNLSVDGGTGGQPQRRAQLVLDRATGKEVRWEPFATQTLGRRVRSILRFVHTGEVLGLPGQTLAGLVSLGAVILALTGLMLSIRRLAAWRARSWRAEAKRDEGVKLAA